MGRAAPVFAAVALALVFSAAGQALQSQVLHARVARVIDGDSIEVVSRDGAKQTIRLAQIDAPERRQPYGPEATRALAQWIQDRDVRIEVVTRDRYGRLVGEVHRGPMHVNLEMVRLGHAWAYTTYVTNLKAVYLEDEARKAGIGLWGLPTEERDPPWQWRSDRRNAPEPAQDAAAPDVRCGTKKTCGQMTSCAEARAYLEQCGLTRLDGDRDGTPCESLCR